MRKDGDHVRIAAQLVDVATGSHIWAERYDRDLADVFAVQDEITQAVVAAIEPQLYAAENFRIRRKTPDNMDAWDLVMRALSHYWRVTRQDNLVAQALLEKAIAVDPAYGQALSCWRPATRSRPYGLGGNVQSRSDGGARGAGGDPRRQRGRVGALCARQRLSVLPALRRLPRRIRAGAAAQSQFLARARHLRRGAVLSRALGGGRSRRSRGAETLARDPFAAIYCGVSAYCQYIGGNYAEAIRLSREALRQRTDFVGAHRVLTAALGMAGGEDAAKAALAGLRRAQPNLTLAWLASELPFEHDADKAHYVEGFRRAGLT